MNGLRMYWWQLMLSTPSRGLPAALGIGWERSSLPPKHQVCIQFEKPPMWSQKRRDPPWTSGLAPTVSSCSGRWASALTLEPTGPSLLVFGDALNKAEERGCHPGTVIQKNPLRPVKEERSMLPRAFGQWWDPRQMNNCGSWTSLWWPNNEL